MVPHYPILGCFLFYVLHMLMPIFGWIFMVLVPLAHFEAIRGRILYYNDDYARHLDPLKKLCVDKLVLILANMFVLLRCSLMNSDNHVMKNICFIRHYIMHVIFVKNWLKRRFAITFDLRHFIVKHM